MHAFARNFCEPALDVETIKAVCAKTGDPVPRDQKPPSRCAPEVMESLRLRGVDIETIDNSFPRSPEDCVEACRRSILSRLEISGA